MQKINIELYSKELHKAGLKLTYPRQRIFNVFQKANKPLSAQEIAARILDIHYATVYRNLLSLSQANIINKVPYGFKFRYELSDKFLPHHHYSVCLYCGASFGLNSQHIEYLLEEASIIVGVEPMHHHIEVSGICSKCKAKQQQT